MVDANTRGKDMLMSDDRDRPVPINTGNIRLSPGFEVWMSSEAYEALKRDAQRYQALREDAVEDRLEATITREEFDRQADDSRTRHGVTW